MSEIDGGPRWSGNSVDETIRESVVRGMGTWQVLMIIAALVAGDDIHVTLLAAHAATGVVSLVAMRRRRVPVGVVLGANYAALGLDYVWIAPGDDALAFATWWTSIITMATPALILRTWISLAVSMLAALGSVLAILLLHPQWGVGLAATIVTTGALVTGATHVFVRMVRRMATIVDTENALVEQERLRSFVADQTARETAEDARVLHDTVVNTLSAVANGTAAHAVAAVRDRCARDADVLEQLLAGARPVRRLDVSALCVGRQVDVRRTGLGDAELARSARRLGPAAGEALQGIIDELLRNAEKHAGVSEVSLDARLEQGSLVVRVDDLGVGFDESSAAGLGLGRSVLGRGRDHGIRVSISSRPGRGTSATVTCPLTGDSTHEGSQDPAFARRTGDLAAAGCWAWAASFVALGVALELIFRSGQPAPTFSMLTVVAGLSLLAWSSARRHDTLPAWLAAMIVAGIPVALLLSLSAVDFGRGDVIHWQLMTITPLYVILLVRSRTKAPVLVGLSTVLVTTAWAALTQTGGNVDLMCVIVVGVIAQLSLSAGWLTFVEVIEEVGTRLESAHEAVAAHRRALSAQNAVAEARQRWTDLGLARSLARLRALGDGQDDPRSPTAREECSADERYLRQILLLDPTMIHMQPWFARCLLAARDSGVALHVRSGGSDAPTSEVADSFGRILLAAISSAGHGGRVDASLFDDGDGARLLVVGSAGLVEHIGEIVLPDGWRSRPQLFGEQELLEVEPTAAFALV